MRAACPSPPRPNNLSFVFLALALASLTRVPFAFGYGIDDDEFYTTRYALELFDQPTPEAARRYPLSFFAARIGLELFGLSGAALRWLPLVCGLGAVVMLARRGDRLMGARAAGCAAVLLALWPWHQYFSGLGRYYAPLFLVGVGMCESLERALDGPRVAALVEVALWTIAGVLVHPSTENDVRASACARR
jgi:fatty acid desaturase